jgi:uncharacterized protein YdeI (YjbR/CyaY-like superfamily)
MEITNTVSVTQRSRWRQWLARHHRTEKDIWLVFYRKHTGKTSISYNDAVEEALCYGWIDSTVKGIDDTKYAQRFSPRKKSSSLSQMNIERMQTLIRQKKMTKYGLEALGDKVSLLSRKGFTVPGDILKAIRANPDAWNHFQALPEKYKRIRIAYIESRRRHGEEFFRRSLNNFIARTAKNRRIGFVREMR